MLQQKEEEERRCKYPKEYKNDVEDEEDEEDDDDYSMQDVDSNDDSDSDSSITQELNDLLQDDAISRETYRSMMPSSSLTTPILPLPSSSTTTNTNPFNRTTTRPSTILSSSTTIRPSTTTTTTPTAPTAPTRSFVTQIRTSTLENDNERNWITVTPIQPTPTTNNTTGSTLLTYLFYGMKNEGNHDTKSDFPIRRRSTIIIEIYN